MARLPLINITYSLFAKYTERWEAASIPSGMPSASHGFSHGLKTCHRHVFTPLRGAGLSNPIQRIKIKDTRKGILYFYGVDN
ncbi:MAG: hypothetical protein IKW50_02375, partial [Oscillospiraceae bacterium]|nr:hypothetical protein [Oscillospiraceae bacterium]